MKVSSQKVTTVKLTPKAQPLKDKQTATKDGAMTTELIDGVKIREARTVIDYRGELTEMWNDDWAFDEGGVPYVYHVRCAPGSIRAWVVHLHQVDRFYYPSGRVQVVLYDARDGSPTQGKVNEFYFGEARRALLRIPTGVYHGVRNVGTDDAWFVNMPSTPYRHEDPDKYRLPLDTPDIPFRFKALGEARLDA